MVAPGDLTKQPLALALAAAAVTAALAVPVRAALARTGFIRWPGSRSSHARPTPVGGGISFVLPVTAAWALLGAGSGDHVLVAIAIAGAGIAVTGFLDDRRGLKPTVRLAAHVVAAAAVAATVAAGQVPWSTSWALTLLSPVLVVWCTNLTNFMDGIDGLAASEGLFIAGAAWILWTWHEGDLAVGAALACMAGAMAGFLPWNAPRARMFMGDVGSTWLGFVLSSLALHACASRPETWSLWAILPALFVADATVCVVRRALRRENLTSGHRAHAYQNLSRLARSHAKAVMAFAAGNALLLAAAAAALDDPATALPTVFATYALATGAMVLGKSGVHGVAETSQ
jgi:Fuc2NAc and GlcNAc transferase